jgi:hypothetical protein
MRSILNLSLLLTALAFAYLVVTMLLMRWKGLDMPRARGIAILVFCWGLGQFGIVFLGFVPYLSGRGISLSRRLEYFASESDPMGALIGLVVHVGLGVLLIAGGTYFGLKLVRRGSPANA